MKYEDERLRAALEEDGDPTRLPKDLQKQLLCTKFREWSYEEEVRVFVSLSEATAEGRLHFRPFNDDLQLREVILGAQCDLSLDVVRSLTTSKFPDAITFRARPAWKSFHIVPQESTAP